MTPPGESDLVVIGAGAAGLAAAREATKLGLTVTVLEAKDRIGGRAHTDQRWPGMPWDRGASWLQNATENPLRPIGEALGIAFDRSERESRLWTGRGWADAGLVRERDAYFEAAFAAMARAGAEGFDGPASAAMPRHPRFQAMFESWFAALVGVEPDRISAQDYARFAWGDDSWPIASGYGTLIARFGAEVPASLQTPAERLRWGQGGVVVETPRGAVHGRAAIVAVSTAVLASGRIAFDPPLPIELRDAIAALPLGEAEKVALAYSRDVFGMPDLDHLAFVHDTLEAVRFLIRPFGYNLAIAYIAGRFARALSDEGEAAMIAFAEDRLVDVFGADIRRHRIGAAATGWLRDPEIGGGYSCARPGSAAARAGLATPLGERLFFAGEACSRHSYGTVHGAYESGVAAARAAALQRR